MQKKILISFLLGFSTYFLQAQQFPFHKEIKFIKYLQNNNQIQDAAYALQNIQIQNLTVAQLDTLHFEKGMFYYNIKKLDTSVQSLLLVSKKDTRYNQSKLFAGYALSFLKETDSAKKVITVLNTKDSAEQALKTLQLAGIALLQKNKSEFSQHQSSFSYNNYFLKQEEENLTQYGKSIFSYKKKSKFVAGALSAIIPGAGKWYAGKKKQALGAFFPIISSAILTLEAYKRGGIKDARFWIYGSLFTTFYIGNIWGSTVAVKVRNDEFNKVYENKILFDMHIPLRNFYN